MQTVQVNRFYGLRVASIIFKILTLLAVLGVAIYVASWLNDMFRQNQPATNYSTIGEGIIRALLFYTAYQLIDVVLSINNSLRQLTRQDQRVAEGVGETGEQIAGHMKKITALLEQHHRRLDKLEKPPERHE